MIAIVGNVVYVCQRDGFNVCDIWFAIVGNVVHLCHRDGFNM